MKQTSKQWEHFAEEDPRYYIFANKDTHDERVFWESGLADVDLLWSFLPADASRESLLEIGCGIGRMSNHFAQRVDRVVGADISRRMVDLAIQNARAGNASFRHIEGSGSLGVFDDRSFDIVVMWHVLQHIVDSSIIGRYLAEIARVLRPDGYALLHFDTRPQTPGSWVLSMLPTAADWLLPRKWRYGMRRYRRDSTQLRQTAKAAGLMIVREVDPDTDRHVMVLRKA